jgi:hypothetical protein
MAFHLDIIRYCGKYRAYFFQDGMALGVFLRSCSQIISFLDADYQPLSSRVETNLVEYYGCGKLIQLALMPSRVMASNSASPLPCLFYPWYFVIACSALRVSLLFQAGRNLPNVRSTQFFSEHPAQDILSDSAKALNFSASNLLMEYIRQKILTIELLSQVVYHPAVKAYLVFSLFCLSSSHLKSPLF